MVVSAEKQKVGQPPILGAISLTIQCSRKITMSVTTIVRTSDPSRKEQQRALSERVVNLSELPQVPLLVFLDDRVAVRVRNRIGQENRGVFMPTNERAFGDLPWPSYVAQEIRRPSGSYSFDFPFTAMVYVHGDVCDDEPALAMTLAHELQHFVQYSTTQTTWAWNTILMQCGDLFSSEGFSWCNVPIELEARMKAKRIHQEIFGVEETERYIVRRQESATISRDVLDWKFIQDLDPFMPYNPDLETRLLFQRLSKNENYCSEIRRALTRSLGRPEFDCLVLDELIGDSNEGF
jgi:hypothetical protein